MKIKYLFLAIAATAFLSSYIATDNNLKEGTKAPEIVRVHGEKENLNEGKYTLINFWSPENPESRISNKLFSNYLLESENPNLNFISICTYKDIALAKEVISYDGVDATGRHLMLSDVDSRVIKDYNADEIQQAYLIGPDGKILSFGNDTERILRELSN